MGVQQPTVGRIVHYVSAGSADGRYPSTCRAAIVTEVNGEWNADDPNSVQLTLTVFNPQGQHIVSGVKHDFPGRVPDWDGMNETHLRPYTWHYPDRV